MSAIAVLDAGSDTVDVRDRQAIVEAAYRDHAVALTRRLTSVTRDPDVAEELVHEAFARLAREVSVGRAPDNVVGWLSRVAVNLAMSRGRHLTVAERVHSSLAEPAAEPSPELESIAEEERRALRTALATLSRVDRDALVLAAHGYHGSEIATRLGRSDGATRTLLCRARSRLRVQLVAAGVSR